VALVKGVALKEGVVVEGLAFFFLGVSLGREQQARALALVGIGAGLAVAVAAVAVNTLGALTRSLPKKVQGAWFQLLTALTKLTRVLVWL
jgi:hypothetical protein